MDAEEIYNLWEKLSEFISSKDKEEALDVFLTQIYETDACEINELIDVANEFDDDFFIKTGKQFIREYGLDEEYYD